MKHCQRKEKKEGGKKSFEKGDRAPLLSKGGREKRGGGEKVHHRLMTYLETRRKKECSPGNRCAGRKGERRYTELFPEEEKKEDTWEEGGNAHISMLNRKKEKRGGVL